MKTIKPQIYCFSSLVKSSVTVMMLCSSMTAIAKEKAHIIVKAAEGVSPTELVISKVGQDPANSPYRTNLEKNIYEIDLETDFIESYSITDWTQLSTNSHTKRFVQFLIEDGAQITLTLYDDRIEAVSTGQEQQGRDKMKKLEIETFKPRSEEIDKIEEENEATEKYIQLMDERDQWEIDYYSRNPLISFLLDLDNRLSQHRYNDHTLMGYIQLYNDYYKDKYPGHPAHQSIEKNLNSGLQIYGGTYHDYYVRTLDGVKVSASDYLKPGYNLVICWASWCAPCRRECQEIAAFIDPYLKKGLNVFALTREFKNTEAVKDAVEKDKYPWPTLVDLDNEFGVFDRHGAISSAAFLIDLKGKIIFSDLGPDEVKAALDANLK